MPGTEALVGIYGEIDRAVQLDPLARLRVSQLLSEYKDPSVRWYDDFLKWLAPEDFPRWRAESSEELRPREPRPFPNVIEALDAFTAEDLANARTRARLVFATAVAARAFPQIKEDGVLRHEALSTLSRFAPYGPFAEDLLELLAHERPERFGIRQIPGTQGWWQGVLRFLDDKGVSTIGMEAKPCTAKLVTVPGIDGPAAALRTEFDTEALAFKEATNFMEPENWRTCRGDFWCCMEEEPDPKLTHGQRLYHEIVSSNCDEPGALFRAETRLLFNFMWIPSAEHAVAAVVNYQLADETPSPKDLIQVDEGSLLVSRLGQLVPHGGPGLGAGPGVDRPEKLRITTTKRIKFNYPFSSQAIALMVCALGWLDTGAQLVACAAGAQNLGMRGTNFEGESIPEAMKARSERPGSPLGGPPRSLSNLPVGSPSGSPPGSLGVLCQEGVEIWARALREGAAALEGHAGGEPQE